MEKYCMGSQIFLCNNEINNIIQYFILKDFYSIYMDFFCRGLINCM
jgi:hypothetical protein